MTTSVAVGFSWHHGAAGLVLVADALAPLARHAFTTRDFDAEGRGASAAIAALFGLPERAVVRVHQVHGADVLLVEPHDQDVRGGTPADAIVVRRAETTAAVAVADCVPILLADRGRRVVAAVHAGWRGTAAGVAGATVARIRDAGVPAADLVAAIGPSIGPCCYQVDRPVREALSSGHPHAGAWFTADGPDRWKLDLWEANRAALVAAGVPPDAVSVARQCTFHQPSLFHSFRRDGARAGRLFAAICRDTEPQ